MNRTWRRAAAGFTATITGVGLAVVGSLSPASAAPTTLFISEYIEGSSFNKALEIYNGTGSTVDLVAGNYVLQLYSNGASTPSSSLALTGSVATGDVRVVAHPDAGAVVLGRAQQTSAATINFNGDDAVVLRKGGASGPVLDAIGQVGFRPSPEWGTAAVGTQDSTMRRKASITAGDTVVSDPFDPALEWDGFEIDSFDALGAHPGLPADLG